MSLVFQSICSGSSGNCLVLSTGETTVLIDAGFRSIRGCRQALGDRLPAVDAVVISHLHGDHVQYSSLRVLEEHGLPVYVHKQDVRLLARKHFKGRAFDGLEVRPFTESRFAIGDLSIAPFQIPHDGVHRTYGFEVSTRRNGAARRVVVATDFWDWSGSSQWFRDADLIYLEANYDPDLLNEHWNPNSLYHLSNGDCGHLLRHALGHSRKRPAAVVLGHLSERRNRPGIARDTVLGILDEAGLADIDLHIAPRYDPSEPISVA